MHITLPTRRQTNDFASYFYKEIPSPGTPHSRNLQSWTNVLGHYDIFKQILLFLSLGPPTFPRSMLKFSKFLLSYVSTCNLSEPPPPRSMLHVET